MNGVLIRDVHPSDLPIFFEQQLDPVAVRMAAFFSRDREAFDAHWAKILANPECRIQTIEHDGEVAGNIGSWESEGHRYVGYWLGQPFWGKGIATKALMQFLKKEMRPLLARVAKTNIASRRVLEKCGFKLIGEEKTQPIQPGMEEVDELIYERVKTD
jgi:RimJ/RimL family protein N-acetyltransferase